MKNLTFRKLGHVVGRKSLGGLGLLSATCVVGLLPVSAQTIVQTYNYTHPPNVDQASPTIYANTGATEIDASLSSALSFIKHGWSGTDNVPNSLQARIDAAVPAGHTLQSIQFSYSGTVVNWIAVDSENANASSFTYNFASTIQLIRDFNNSLVAPAPNPGGATIGSTANTSANFTINLAADDDAGVPGVGVDFPFAQAFQGLDSVVRASAAAYTADPGSNARVDPLNRTLAGSQTLTSGAEFLVWQGASPGTIPLSFVATGNLGSFTPNFNLGSRAFSAGDLSVTYTFVPEAGTALGGVAALLGSLAVGRLGRSKR